VISFLTEEFSLNLNSFSTQKTYDLKPKYSGFIHVLWKVIKTDSRRSPLALVLEILYKSELKKECF
jgi:hypothetical protein